MRLPSRGTSRACEDARAFPASWVHPYTESHVHIPPVRLHIHQEPKPSEVQKQGTSRSVHGGMAVRTTWRVTLRVNTLRHSRHSPTHNILFYFPNAQTNGHFPCLQLFQVGGFFFRAHHAPTSRHSPQDVPFWLRRSFIMFPCQRSHSS